MTFRKIFIYLFILTFFVNTVLGNKLNDIKSSGILKAGVKYDFEPFGFLDESGDVIGFDIDLLKYIANDLGVKLKLQQVTSQNRIEMLENGIVDIVAASMTHKQERDKRIDFSISYFFDGQAILTTKYVKVNHHFGFNGKRVGVIKGATRGETFRQKVPKAKIIYFDNYTKALEELNKGNIDAITTDMVWCATQAKKSHGKLRVLKKVLTTEPYGIGVAQNESDFLDAINITIQKAVLDGTYEILYLKWFGKNPEKLPEVWPR